MKKNDTRDQSDAVVPKNTLRIKTGVILAILTIGIRFIIPAIIPATTNVGVLGGMLGGIAILVWWAFFSRAQRMERWGAILIILAAMVLSSLLLHDSISTAMQGMMFPAYALPVLCPVFVIWAVATRNQTRKVRWGTMIAAIVLSSGAWTLVRSDGITGHAQADFVWRWSASHEEQLLANSGKERSISSAGVTLAGTQAEWPGFRGSWPGRSCIRNENIH